MSKNTIAAVSTESLARPILQATRTEMRRTSLLGCSMPYNVVYCLLILSLRTVYGYEAVALLGNAGLPHASLFGVTTAVWMLLLAGFILRVIPATNASTQVTAAEILVQAVQLSINFCVAYASPNFPLALGILTAAQLVETFLAWIRPTVVAGLELAFRKPK